MALQLPPDAQGHLPNCGLTAMAVAAGKTLKEATEAYQKACEKVRGRRMQGNWKGRTYNRIRDKAMVEYMGLKLQRIPVHGMSLQKLSRYLQPNVKYIITTTGHVQVVESGCVVDQSGVFSMDEYWGRRKKVTDVLVIKEN
ncbi:MAG: hypothetical protein CMF22_10380 [Idiomarinaceae bacterium]|nr:hypothetical protein [Idiomarinaceae bacterium]MBG23847.1 hypothetical protein [Idiomarinaceae bacterium]|tara:strand:+ start:21619 stop:22041 length:423 start_codon:yes stop_codon:yes gene_type:complete